MKLKIHTEHTRLIATLIGACCLVFGSLPALALKYNDGNSTNYLGSVTNDFRLKVGVDEPGNILFITNGGIAAVTEVYVGESTDSIDNLLSVTNGGLLFAGNIDTNNVSTGGVYVGDTDGTGQISVNNSSELDTDFLYLGKGADETGMIDVTGNSLLNIREQIYVGATNNSENILTISKDGALFINETSDLIIANISGASNDLNAVNIESSGKLLVGGDVNATSLIGTSNLNLKAGAILGVGGSLSIDNSAIEDSLTIILDNDLSSNTSRWNSSEIYVGDKTKNNSLTLTNGATASANGDIIYIGNQSAASGNSLNVYGSNSVLTAGDKLLVGNNGDRNLLNISEGGTAVVALDLKVGNSIGAEQNSVFVGTNSTLTVNQNLIVGANGNKSTMTVEDGQVDVAGDVTLGLSSVNNRYNQTGGTSTVAGDFIIGNTENASGKTINGKTDTTGNLGSIGKGATLDIGKNLTVGKEGDGSILLINDGGTINVSGNTIIGEAASDNYIFLQPDDPDTRFNVSGDLVVSKDGENNRFAIYGGTANIGESLYLGSSTNQHVKKNYIHLETTNAVLNVANAIYIGASNSVNTLDLVAGATATAQDLFVGTYAGVSNNVVTVTGEDSLLYITNNLEIGSSIGSNNAVIVENGGTLNVEQSNIGISGTNNTLNIADGGILKTLGWDFGAMTNSSTNIVFDAGSTLHLLGLLEGTNMANGGLNFVLDGTNSAWTVATNMYVGFDSNNNSLTITNGASATASTNLYIGYGDSADNTVTVAGAGSVLNVGNDLFIGTEVDDNTESLSGNMLSVIEGANILVDNNAYVYRGATLKIDSASQVTVAGDYEQDQYSTLEVGVSSNQVQPNLVVDNNAEFNSRPNSDFTILKVYDDGISESNVVNIVQAKTITVDGNNATTASIIDNVQTNLLLDFDISISNGLNNTFIVLDDFIKRSIGEAAGLEGQLLAVSDEIIALKELGNSNAVAMVKLFEDMTANEANTALDNYYGKKMSSTPANNVINMGLQSVAEQLIKRADNTRSRMGVASSSKAWNKPAGVAGPHAADQELQGWITGYGTWGSKDASDGFDGYDANLQGFLVGADLSVAENILMGVAGGSGSATADKDNSASTDTRTTFISIYGSFGTKDWFADASFIYGGSSVDSSLGSTFDTKAEYDAKNVAFYLGGGKEILGKYLIFTPQASLLANYYKQDAYEEKSSNAVGRDVNSFDTLYVQSSLGGSLGFYTAMGDIILKPEIRAHWLHEWNAKEESLGYSLIGGSNNYSMLLQAPEEDILKIGIGSSAKVGEYLELRADLDARMGADYGDYTLLGSLRYQF